MKHDNRVYILWQINATESDRIIGVFSDKYQADLALEFAYQNIVDGVLAYLIQPYGIETFSKWSARMGKSS